MAFTILFGSRATGNHFPFSDTDIAIYVDKPMSYLERGSMIFELEEKYKTDVDLVILNEVIEENPLLAYNIITQGELIEYDDYDQYAEVKAKIFKYYFDTEPLRNLKEKYLKKRIKALTERLNHSDN